MKNIDVAFAQFSKILEEIKGYESTIFSEQDSRIKIIDRILIEVLGFKFEDILTEPKSGEGFIDYKISINAIPRLIVEAKKDGLDFEIGDSYNGRAFKLNGPVFKNQIVQDGLRQAIIYSAMEGVELACLTNGRTWIILKANRTSENKNVFDGKAFVFSNLESLRNEFKLFYELLCPESISSFRYRAILQEVDVLI